MLVHYLTVASSLALFGYMGSILALAVRLESIRRTNPLAKTIPVFGAFLLGVPAWPYIWSSRPGDLKDRWVGRWIVLNRVFMAAAVPTWIALAFAQSQAGY